MPRLSGGTITNVGHTYAEAAKALRFQLAGGQPLLVRPTDIHCAPVVLYRKITAFDREPFDQRLSYRQLASRRFSDNTGAA
jgi:hypothetical protein